MLRTENLRYTYPEGATLQFPDLYCPAGEHWLLLGQSGSGKTTLLHLLAGLLTPREGGVFVGDTALHRLRGSALDRFRGRHIGLVFQQPHFVRSLNVGGNLLLAQHLAGQPTNRERVSALLDSLNLGDKMNRPVDQLSVGERQRVAIARAIINQPSVVLADEPTSALDDQNSERVIRLLEEQCAAVNATLLIVTHDLRLKDHFSHRLELGQAASSNG